MKRTERKTLNYEILAIIDLFLLSAHLFAACDAPQSFIDKVKMFAEQEKEARHSIMQLLDRLTFTSTVLLEGTDAQLRPMFVNIQADFERAIVSELKSKAIASSVCVIHTPAPATPLCTQGEISEGLVDPAILHHPERLLTVKKRPDIIRDYLQEGGILWTAYPQNGRMMRSKEQLEILDNLAEKYPDHLELVELDCTEIPQDLIGATYVITFADASKWCLSFRSYQANAPTDGAWAIWYGPIDDPAVVMRLEQIETLLKASRKHLSH
jgi:hypothetical protein